MPHLLQTNYSEYPPRRELLGWDGGEEGIGGLEWEVGNVREKESG